MKSQFKTWPGSKPTGKKRTFSVTVSKEMTFSVDESVIQQGMLPDNPIMGNPSEDEVVEHLAFNIVGNGLLLSQIDGYSNCPDDSASVKEGHTSVEFYELAASRRRKR